MRQFTEIVGNAYPTGSNLRIFLVRLYTNVAIQTAQMPFEADKGASGSGFHELKDVDLPQLGQCGLWSNDEDRLQDISRYSSEHTYKPIHSRELLRIDLVVSYQPQSHIEY